MKSWLVASAAGLALLAGIPTANAVTPVLSVPSLEILHVPFSPPTDVDIVYDVTQIRPGDAKKGAMRRGKACVLSVLKMAMCLH